MSEKRWTDDERSEAFERGLKTMEGVALELYRRGREPLLEELETVKRERDEARAEVERLRETIKLMWSSCGCCKCTACSLAKQAIHPKKAKAK